MVRNAGNSKVLKALERKTFREWLRGDEGVRADWN